MAPYVLDSNQEPSEWYEKFMKKYKKAHEVCPKCGSTISTQTLMGYIVIKGKEEGYKNLNDCRCLHCGDKHTVHERISKKEFKNKKS